MMKNALLIATCLITFAGVVAVKAAASSFPSTNSDEGCWIVMANVVTSIDELNKLKAADCAMLKSQADGDALKCMLGAAIARHKMRREPELDRLPNHVTQSLAKGCAMLVYDLTAADADRLVRSLER
jgi:hypothetical protein